MTMLLHLLMFHLRYCKIYQEIKTDLISRSILIKLKTENKRQKITIPQPAADDFFRIIRGTKKNTDSVNAHFLCKIKKSISLTKARGKSRSLSSPIYKEPINTQISHLVYRQKCATITTLSHKVPIM